MNSKPNKLIALFTLLFALSSLAHAEESELSRAIQEQVDSANDCVALAYDVTLEHMNADEVFKDCVERRAIIIGMQKRYGPGKYGEIDVFDKIEGYSHLAESKNPLVEKEANTFSTAAGSEQE